MQTEDQPTGSGGGSGGEDAEASRPIAVSHEAPPAPADPAKVAVLGAGSWGTVFAKVAADAALAASRPADELQTDSHGFRQPSGDSVPAWTTILWGRDEEAMRRAARTRINDRYFPQHRLPAALEITADVEAALTGADVVVLALPAQVLRGQLEQLSGLIEPSATLLSLAKGLERGTGQRMSEVISEVLPAHTERIAVLSGPNLAREIIQEQPTASVVAARSPETAGLIARVCAAPYFRPYTSSDVVGAEIGGLTKNVIALCVGICEGRDLGDNSKASIMTRGLAETTRLAMALGARPETMAGLAGMGDLVATCSSPLSRNHTAGRLLGAGLSEAEVAARMTQTAEGIKSASVVRDLAARHGIEMPIVEAVTAILSGEVHVDQLQPLLLSRRLKAETPH